MGKFLFILKTESNDEISGKGNFVNYNLFGLM